MEKKLFVGVDVGKEGLVAALAHSAWQTLSNPRPFPNTPRGYAGLVRWVGHSQNGRSIHLCAESTGVYGEKFIQYISARTGWRVSIVNPLQAKRFFESQLVRTKTDPSDAEKLAAFAAACNPPAYQPRSREMEELYQLIKAYWGFQKLWVQQRNRLKDQNCRARPSKPVRIFFVRAVEILGKLVREAKEEIGLFVKTRPSLKQKVELLSSIPGIGTLSACQILALLSSKIKGRTVKQVISYAALAPVEKQSGTSIRVPAHLPPQGNKAVQGILHMPTLVAIRYNPPVRKLWERLLKRRKTKRQALGACRAKLLRICLGVLKSQKPFSASLHNKKSL